ncbi:MAG: hypothetical protein RR764_10710, partial [Oscillospiraceae bacterium]
QYALFGFNAFDKFHLIIMLILEKCKAYNGGTVKTCTYPWRWNGQDLSPLINFALLYIYF